MPLTLFHCFRARYGSPTRYPSPTRVANNPRNDRCRYTGASPNQLVPAHYSVLIDRKFLSLDSYLQECHRIGVGMFLSRLGQSKSLIAVQRHQLMVDHIGLNRQGDSSSNNRQADSSNNNRQADSSNNRQSDSSCRLPAADKLPTGQS